MICCNLNDKLNYLFWLWKLTGAQQTSFSKKLFIHGRVLYIWSNFRKQKYCLVIRGFDNYLINWTIDIYWWDSLPKHIDMKILVLIKSPEYMDTYRKLTKIPRKSSIFLFFYLQCTTKCHLLQFFYCQACKEKVTFLQYMPDTSC